MSNSLWSFSFPSRDAAEERAYREYYLQDDIGQLTSITYFAVAFMVCLSLIDVFQGIDDKTVQEGLMLRTPLMVGGVLVIWLAGRYRSPLALDLSALGYSALITSMILTYYSTSELSILRMATVGILFIYVVNMAYPTYAVYSSTPLIFLIAGDAYIFYSSTNPEYVQHRALVMLIFCTSLIIAVLWSALLQRSRYHAFESARRVKTLSGLLPICSNCKNIRDDSGFYQSVEQYIEEHSDAEFTHGICPDCVRELYPQAEQNN